MKPKILYINTVCGYVATGRITAALSKSDEYDSLVCYGRKEDFAKVNSFKFANFFDNAFGAIRTILFDNNLNICKTATKKLINKIKEYNPDIIHIHNLHGYYVNVEMLFKFLKEFNKPVVWTLHDCWPITGYCPTADYVNCKKYEIKCENCPRGFAYPFSLFKQNLDSDYKKKKQLFNDIDNLYLVTPSNFMKSVFERSFLKEKDIRVINNGIDLSNFKPSKEKNKNFSILAVSNVWNEYKGTNDLIKMLPLLDKDINVTIVGKNSNQFNNCNSISYTNNLQELIDLYSSSHILINPTLDDNFPTVNIESLACGTPIVTYKTGGSPEIIDEKTGIVIEKGNYNQMAKVINDLKNNYAFNKEDCLNRAKLFSLENMKDNYLKLYKEILK